MYFLLQSPVRTKYPAYNLSPKMVLKLYNAPPNPAVVLPSSMVVARVPEEQKDKNKGDKDFYVLFN